MAQTPATADTSPEGAFDKVSGPFLTSCRDPSELWLAATERKCDQSMTNSYVWGLPRESHRWRCIGGRPNRPRAPLAAVGRSSSCGKLWDTGHSNRVCPPRRGISHTNLKRGCQVVFWIQSSPSPDLPPSGFFVCPPFRPSNLTLEPSVSFFVPSFWNKVVILGWKRTNA